MVGDDVYIMTRTKVVDIGSEMVYLELEELRMCNVLHQPTFLWAPISLIEEDEVGAPKEVKQEDPAFDRPPTAVALRDTPNVSTGPDKG